MKKLRSFSIFTLFIMLISLSLPLVKVIAYTLESSHCGTNNYALVDVTNGGAVNLVQCFGLDYTGANNAMMARGDSDTSTPSIIYNQRIVSSKYGIVDLTRISGTANLYVNGSVFTYISGVESSDAAFIQYNPADTAFELAISGLRAWKYPSSSGSNQEIIPLSLAKSISYYLVDGSGVLWHYFARHITENNSYRNSIPLGPAPSQLASGIRYYSYDGHYFYTNAKTMINNYRANVSTNAVNPTAPYYNYYQYLPYHSRTTYTGSAFDSYMNNLINAGQVASNSKMKDQGTFFYNSQELYGANAATTFAIASNESARGQSNIAHNYNNLFGHSAYDSDPSNATGYGTVSFGIYHHAEKFISSGYGDVSYTDFRYYGLFLGNKASGVNVKYASDPYWGEKAAQYHYLFDKANGMHDYNYYQLAIKTNADKTPLYKGSNTGSGVSYYMSSNNALNGSGKAVTHMSTLITADAGSFYKIMSDSKTNSSGGAIADPVNAPAYSFVTAQVYAPKNALTFINTGKYGYISPTNTTASTVNVEVYGAPKVLQLNENKDIYDSEYLNDANGTLQKDTYVIATKRGYNSSGTVAYYVVTNIANNTGGWIKAAHSTISSAYETTKTIGTSINVRSAPNLGGTVLTTISAIDTPLVVLDAVYGENISGNHTWLLIQIPNANQLGYVTASLTNYTKVVAAPGSVVTANYNSYLHELKWVNNQLHIEGFITLYDTNNALNSQTTYKLKLINQNNQEPIFINLPRWLTTSEFPFEIPNKNGKEYRYSWYKAALDLTTLPQGDYTVYIVGEVGSYKAEALLSNTFQRTITRKQAVNGRGYHFRSNYDLRTMPLELFVRNDELLSYDIPKSISNSFADYTVNGINITNDGKLYLKGTSYNFYVDYNSTIQRSVIFENISTFNRIRINNLGYTNAGDYNVISRPDDTKGKKNAWFNNNIDITGLPVGKYSINILTTANGFTDYSELMDGYQRNLNISKVIGGKTYSLHFVKDKRTRIELWVN